jgi:hypothetical protein
VSARIFAKIARVLKIAASECERIDAEETLEHVGFIDQRTSPAGTRTHMAMTRRRVQAGLPGAAIVGRRFLLSPEALQEEQTIASTRARCMQRVPRLTWRVSSGCSWSKEDESEDALSVSVRLRHLRVRAAGRLCSTLCPLCPLRMGIYSTT